MEIVQLLMEKERCVKEICEKLGEEQSKISHNLRKLKDCHFIDVVRQGKQRVYSLNRKTILPLMRLVEKHVHSYCGKECTKK